MKAPARLATPGSQQANFEARATTVERRYRQERAGFSDSIQVT